MFTTNGTVIAIACCGRGPRAYDPRILLKIVPFACSRGIVSGRRIEPARRENGVFMALSADSQPHWTPIADFVSHRQEAIAGVFQEVLRVCDSLGLLGRELFAEPPFVHLRHAKGLNRFTLRGRAKVNGQWKLYGIVHNLWKVHRYGEGFT